MTNNSSQEKAGEKIIYAASVCGSVVLSIREYESDAEINKAQVPAFIMSISYLSGSKQGTVFLLTRDGRVSTKIYEYSTRDHEYHLFRQSVLMDTAEALFDQFEHDFRISPYLQSLDYDSSSMGKFISKRIRTIHPVRSCIEDIKQFEIKRDSLSYTEKLSQQLGHRNDPIEYVLKILHAWKGFVEHCNELRRVKEREELNAKKSHPDKKILSCMEDSKKAEDYYYEAVDELEKIKKQIASGVCDSSAAMKIKAKLPKIREIIEKQDLIFKEIEKTVEEDDADALSSDLKMSELY